MYEEDEQHHQQNVHFHGSSHHHLNHQDEGPMHMGHFQKWKREKKMLQDLQFAKWEQQRIKNVGTRAKWGGEGGSISSLSDMTEDYKAGCTAAFCVQETLVDAMPL